MALCKSEAQEVYLQARGYGVIQPLKERGGFNERIDGLRQREQILYMHH